MASGDKHNRRSFLKYVGVSVSGALAGCTTGGEGDGGDGTGGSDGGDGSPSPTDGSGDGGTGGQSLPQNEAAMADGSLASSLDPADNVDSPTTITALQYYDPLLFVSSNQEIIEFLATSWTAEDDTTWVFELRDDVQFHTGNTMTADDVAYSFNRMTAIGKGYVGKWNGLVEEASARSDTEVEVNLTKTFGPLIATLPRMFVVDSTVVQEHEEGDDWGQAWLQNNEAGAGAYLNESFNTDDEAVYEAFEDYWQGWESNQIKTFRQVVIPEVSSKKSAMRQGTVHLSETVLTADAYAEMDSYPNAHTIENPSPWIYHFPLNCQQPPTDDFNVRKGLAHSFDYETTIQEIFQASMDLIAEGPVPDTIPGKNEDLSPYEYDLDKAKEEFDKSSYTIDEISDMMQVVYPSGETIKRQNCTMWQSDLNELGIELEIQALPWPQVTEAASEAEATPPATSVFHAATMLSPDDFTYLMFHPDAFGTYISMSWYSSDELQSVIEEARTSLDTQEAYDLYKEAQRLIWEAYPSVFVMYPPTRQTVNNNLKGYTWRGTMGYQNRFYDFYWEE